MAYFTPYTIVDFFCGSQRCGSLVFSTFRGKAVSRASVRLPRWKIKKSEQLLLLSKRRRAHSFVAFKECAEMALVLESETVAYL